MKLAQCKLAETAKVDTGNSVKSLWNTERYVSLTCQM